MNVIKQMPVHVEIATQAGYETYGSLVFLHHLVWERKPDCILELGTGYGASTVFMAESLGCGGTIVSIDDLRDQAMDMAIPRANIDKCGLTEKVILIEGSSLEADRLFCLYANEIASPEILFMDASHNKADMQRELAVARRILCDNHMIIVDDMMEPGVAEFVVDLIEWYDFCLIFWKLHRGVAVLGTESRYICHAVSAYREAIG